jgi:DNA-binding transcriptional regulator YiaG
MDKPPHRAGAKIRAWRARHAMSAEDFGRLIARQMDGRTAPFTRQTVHKWEVLGKVARAPVQRAMAELGVCGGGDWIELAEVVA